MFSLTRTEFPDRLLDCDDLDDIAALWRDWHAQTRDATLHTYESVRLRLWGCARQDVAHFVRKLEERLAAERLDGTVVLDDSEYLTVTGPFEEASARGLLGAWLALIADRSFDGLVAFFEFTIRDWYGDPEGPAAAGGTIVLCGLLQPKGFRLKALWPVGLEPGFENLYKATVWPDQVHFLNALELFRDGMTPPAPRHYFDSRHAQRRSNWLVSLLIHVPGEDSLREGRLGSFLFRFAFHVSVVAFLAALIYVIPDGLAKAILAGCLAVPVGALAFVLGFEIWRVWKLYWRMRASLNRAYSRPANYEIVNAADYELGSDANACKYSRELEAAGCRHMADVRHMPPHSGTFVNRIFIHPEERTYVFFNLMQTTANFRKFPAHGFYLIVTHLTDGRIVTLNEGGGYRPSLNPNSFTRRFPGIDDPAVLLARHKKFVAEVCARGHELAPLADLTELLERMKEAHDENRPLMEKYGYYTWSAAFRQSFELVRSEYLE